MVGEVAAAGAVGSQGLQRRLLTKLNLVSVIESEGNRWLSCCSSFLFKTKAEPAGVGPPADVLLPSSKSKQKCLLLAEGIFLCVVSVISMGS